MENHAKSGFMQLLLNLFRYPLQSDGPVVMVAGAVVFTMADYASAYASIFGILIQIASAGYLVAYAKDVVRTSAMGEDHPPGWLDFSDLMDDLITPTLQGVVVLGLAFGGIIFLQFKPPAPTLAGQVLWVAAGIWGCLIFPVLVLVVAMADSLLSLLNPRLLLRTIGVTLPHYLLVSLLGALIIVAGIEVDNWLSLFSQIPIAPNFIDRLVSIYLVTVLMRSFGLLYRYYHERLQWY